MSTILFALIGDMIKDCRVNVVCQFAVVLRVRFLRLTAGRHMEEFYTSSSEKRPYKSTHHYLIIAIFVVIIIWLHKHAYSTTERNNFGIEVL